MIKNFFRIAFRNITKHKGFAIINVVGLAVGLAASLLILLWVQNELSYETFNVNAENIYRVEEDQFYSGERYHVTVTPHPSGPVWKEKIPEIKAQTRLNRLPRILFRQGDKTFFESAIVAADSGMLKIFTMPLVLGDPLTALNLPQSIILTEKLASKYFGKSNPIGKTLRLENAFEFTVTGVMKDLPKNSMFSFEGVVPYSFLNQIGAVSDSWGNNSIFTFLLLENGSDITSVNRKLTDVVIEHNPETTTKFVLFPLLDIHLHTQFGFTENNNAVTMVYIFILIALFVLLIACINFINLNTAKAASRSKEIGIKKAVGADQVSLINQFMLESLALVTIALMVALVIVGLSLGLFNNLTGKSFEIYDLLQPRFIISFLCVGLLAGFISGIYPAFYLSSIKPVEVLKGETVSGKKNGRLRQILVIIQFTLSMLIAIAAVFMYLQLKFMQNKELGFNKENLLCIPMSDKMKGGYYPLKQELQNESLILGVTATTMNPVMIGSNSGGADWEGKDPEKHVLIGFNAIDYDYLSTLKMELVSGRDFSKEYPADFAKDTLGNFLVNEEVVKIMNIGDPVGKSFSFIGVNGRIVGVLKNFHFKGADQPIEPIAFALTDTSYLNYILIRLSPEDVSSSLKVVEKVWKKVIPDYPLNYTFIDQDYDNLFRSQLRIAELLKYFTLLAVLIACLGLYGLSYYSAQRRTNEIGIRKVMGAGSKDVVYSMSKEFMILVSIAIIIAIPVGYLIVDKLLSQFAYRVNMNPLVFILTGAGAFLVAMLTVSLQSLKATKINPSEALKVE